MQLWAAFRMKVCVCVCVCVCERERERERERKTQREREDTVSLCVAQPALRRSLAQGTFLNFSGRAFWGERLEVSSE